MKSVRDLVRLLLVLTVPLPVGGAAAQPVPLELSLDEAVALARRHNPAFLATANDVEVADWEVRSAWGQLLPSASAGGGLSWQGAGEQRFGSLTAEELGFRDQPSFYFSSYNLGLQYRLDGATLFAPGRARASRQQTLAQVDAAAVDLTRRVTLAYLEVLRQVQAVGLATQELERARFNLRLATAQSEVGTVTVMDVQQAEVQVGRSEVALLRARTAERTARLRLLQVIGVDVDQDVVLTTEFGLAPPPWTEEELVGLALERNPVLLAYRRSREVQDVQVDVARSAYWPSLSLSAGLSGFTREASSPDYLIRQAQSSVASQIANCHFQNDLFSRLTEPLPLGDCSRFRFTDQMRDALVEGNDQFPFSFEASPPSASLSVSVPVFTGFDRQLQLEAAQAARRDAELQIREQELALEADVAIGLEQVRAAYESALIERRNQAFADEQLRLAGERYRVGTISFIDLVEAETVKAQADRERVAAVFAYHDAVAALEAVVGTQLRDPDPPAP